MGAQRIRRFRETCHEGEVDVIRAKAKYRPRYDQYLGNDDTDADADVMVNENDDDVSNYNEYLELRGDSSNELRVPLTSSK